MNKYLINKINNNNLNRTTNKMEKDYLNLLELKMI